MSVCEVDLVKALLVIDIQEVTIGKKHAKFFQYDDTLVSMVNRVIDENKDNVVVYIRNIMKKNLLNRFAPFQAYEGSKAVELIPDLHIVSDHIFDKFTSDAFSNKQLVEFLKINKIDKVEVIGVDGGGCVSLTALGALQNGYEVIVNTKAIGTVMKKKRDTYFKKLEKLGAKFI